MSGVPSWHDDLATLRKQILEAMTGDATYWPDSAEHDLDAYVEARCARLQQALAKADKAAGGIRLSSDEIDDLCYRHCELGESLSEEEIDRLIDTASAAHARLEAITGDGTPKDTA